MPIGGFLDTLPSVLFVGAHVLFLGVGIWASRHASTSRAGFAAALWLYAISQIVFLGFFGGVITMKMAVLIEQTLIVLMVLTIASRPVAAR